MTRAFFLFLSHQRTLRRWMETSGIAHKLTKRFVAGDTLDDEIEVCRRLQREGILSTLDRLGENVNSLEEAAASATPISSVLDRIHESGLPSTVSIKLTQFGLDFSYGGLLPERPPTGCRAREIGTIIEIDMESSDYTDRTLDIVIRLAAEIGGVRAVIQAYLAVPEPTSNGSANCGFRYGSARAPTTNPLRLLLLPKAKSMLITSPYRSSCSIAEPIPPLPLTTRR